MRTSILSQRRIIAWSLIGFALMIAAGSLSAIALASGADSLRTTAMSARSADRSDTDSAETASDVEIAKAANVTSEPNSSASASNPAAGLTTPRSSTATRSSADIAWDGNPCHWDSTAHDFSLVPGYENSPYLGATAYCDENGDWTGRRGDGTLNGVVPTGPIPRPVPVVGNPAPTVVSPAPPLVAPPLEDPTVCIQVEGQTCDDPSVVIQNDGGGASSN